MIQQRILRNHERQGYKKRPEPPIKLPNKPTPFERACNFPIPFGCHQGTTLEHAPIVYLDWLQGQSWIYGTFAARLNTYLKIQAHQDELDRLYSDDDSHRPAFMAHPDAASLNHLNITSQEQRREPMPRTEPEPYTPTMTPGRAWAIAADAVLIMEDTTDPSIVLDFHEPSDDYYKAINVQQLHAALQLLGTFGNFTVIRAVRDAYRTMILRLRTADHTPIHELLAAYRLKTLPAIIHKLRHHNRKAKAG